MVLAASIGAIGGLASMVGGVAKAQSARAAARRQYEYQSKLMAQQFNYNKWFGRNHHQQEVLDLKDAGLNPILSADSGTGTGSVGLGSVGIDESAQVLNTAESNAINSYNAQSQRMVSTAQAYNQVQQGNLTIAQANQMNSAAQLNNSQTQLTNLQSMAQQITNSHLPKMLKSQIMQNIATAQASMITAYANRTSASAQQMNAQTNAQWAGYNAHSGRIGAYGGAVAAGAGILGASAPIISKLIKSGKLPKSLIKPVGSMPKLINKYIQIP